MSHDVRDVIRANAIRLTAIEQDIRAIKEGLTQLGKLHNKLTPLVLESAEKCGVIERRDETTPDAQREKQEATEEQV